MECPKFSNYISLTNNISSDECVLNFFHDFPVLKEIDDDGKIEMGVSRSHVCGVVLTQDKAKQLYDMLGRHFAKGKGDE